MSLFKRKGHDYEKPFVKGEVDALVEKVRNLDEEEFQMFLDSLGLEAEEKPVAPEGETPAEAEAKADDTVADAEVQDKADEVVADIDADKAAEAKGEQPDYDKTNTDESELKDAVDKDLQTDAAVQEAQAEAPQQAELPDASPEQAAPVDSNTPAPQEQAPEVEPMPEAVPEQDAPIAPATPPVESETIAALVARCDALEEKLAILAEQKAQVPAYGGVSRQSVLADSDVGSTQDGKPRTIEEWRRRYSNLNNK